MNRCIQLARLGMGEVAPNPMVGAVIVHNDKIIGEGFHRQYGGPHAEVNAVNAVKDQSLLSESTIYVSLEPCAHFGKTPPCSDLIISHRIPHVVVGSVDPFAEVAGKGIEKMRKAGIRVDLGVLGEECLELNRRFFTFHQQKRPYVILKWAQTLDGFLDRDRILAGCGKPNWISNELSRRLVHRQRTEEAAILIGTNTALKDNPSLTVRDWDGKQPVRMALDRSNRLPDHLQIKDGRVPTVIFTEKEVSPDTNTAYVQLDFAGQIVPQILQFLYNRQLQSVVVEGGRQLLQSFIDHDLWDEAHVYIGNNWFGAGVEAPRLVALPSVSEMLDDTRLEVFYRKS
ncbi:bifunctional diaminohydroxyphosphoribosylaminopyrimidine deaminase/5-amino-6-(5-phosphoribosylamino)uracil reductase RibD [Gaoshiqia sp. Z1-71]|uniref:bifunctional diaminohydroxyphosphoribosylaminopyrimidine deaminase/5-amino-6-(5-phosphoribosylamino)uracil reductase RibD n=1 Tax=Gaoshiqia hydrogeniformans TaxID=3290090 RepID=UPI003BF7EA72